MVFPEKPETFASPVVLQMYGVAADPLGPVVAVFWYGYGHALLSIHIATDPPEHVAVGERECSVEPTAEQLTHSAPNTGRLITVSRTGAVPMPTRRMRRRDGPATSR